MDKLLIERLKDRYPNIHPLIFHRSVERAKSPGDLFDILDTFQQDFPVVWDAESRRWVKTDNIHQKEERISYGNS